MARIVVIEDDGALRNDIADHLGDWGHDVFQASTGALGLKLIKEVHPDLVLCDICMPSGSGFDVVKGVRDDPFGSAHIAIIFISSLADESAQVYGAHCGADDYIVKPINYDELKSKILHHSQKNNSLVARFAKLITGKTGPKTGGSAESKSKSTASRSFGRRKADADAG